MIMEQVHQLCQNRARQKLTIQDFESLIEDGVFNEEGITTWQSPIIIIIEKWNLTIVKWIFENQAMVYTRRR